MDIPINVDVVCASELCGRATSIIINPINDQVTHVVVTENGFPYIAHLVPVNNIFVATPNLIQLRCRKSELTKMEVFEETDFINSGYVESSLPYNDPYYIWPYGMYEDGPIQFEHKHIPAGEIAIHRGTPVYAKDGKVGKVDEFLVDPKNNIITHLVLREGHLWGKKDVTIPISEIDKIMEEEVDLKLDKKTIEKLPAIPVKRRWL